MPLLQSRIQFSLERRHFISVAGGRGLLIPGVIYRYLMHGTDRSSHWLEVEIFGNPNRTQVWAFWKFVWKNPSKGEQALKARATSSHLSS